MTPVPQIVLDPFGGSGTTAQIADRHGRNAIICELKDDYSDQAQRRMMSEAPMFTELEVQ
jgi:DNA modification methylase